MSDDSGMFTPPGPDGILGRGGPPQDMSSPAVDSTGHNIRETMVVAYPSPGHMRVARALKYPNGKVEFQEQYREPTADEKQWLANRGVDVGPGSVVTSGQQPGSMGEIPPPDVGGTGLLAKIPGPVKVVGLIGIAALVGFGGYKYVWPMLKSDDDAKGDDDDDDDGDDD